jgi:hypothetical protein
MILYYLVLAAGRRATDPSAVDQNAEAAWNGVFEAFFNAARRDLGTEPRRLPLVHRIHAWRDRRDLEPRKKDKPSRIEPQ